jgi:hypothetical protein
MDIPFDVLTDGLKKPEKLGAVLDYRRPNTGTKISSETRREFRSDMVCPQMVS